MRKNLFSPFPPSLKFLLGLASRFPFPGVVVKDNIYRRGQHISTPHPPLQPSQEKALSDQTY